MPTRLRRVARRLEDRGASAVEYGLMVAAIAAVIVAVTFGLGRIVSGAFSQTCSVLAASIPADGSCSAPTIPPADPPADPGAGPGADPVPAP